MLKALNNLPFYTTLNFEEKSHEKKMLSVTFQRE